MPAAVVQSIAKQAGKSVSSVEAEWDKIKGDVAKQAGKKPSDLSGDDWAKVTYRLKRHFGLEDSTVLTQEKDNPDDHRVKKIKTLPASSAPDDPEQRKKIRQQWLDRGYDGVRWEGVTPLTVEEIADVAIAEGARALWQHIPGKAPQSVFDEGEGDIKVSVLDNGAVQLSRKDKSITLSKENIESVYESVNALDARLMIHAPNGQLYQLVLS